MQTNKKTNWIIEAILNGIPIKEVTEQKIDPYKVCTVAIGKTAGTQKRSEWNNEEKKRYDRCLKDLENK
jgi:hypothetical protein